MYIHEAIKARTADEPYITRERWHDRFNPRRCWESRIRPTDSPDCCIIESKHTATATRGWQPMAEDLCADDWITSR